MVESFERSGAAQNLLGLSVSATAPQPSRVHLPPIEDVLEYTTDCVAVLNRDWRFTYLNRNAREVLCRGRDLIGAHLHEVFASERGTKEWKQTQEAARERGSTSFEFFASHLALWFEVHIHPIPSGLQIYFRDVTQRREVETALAKREEALRLALQAVGDAAWDWDIAKGTISITGEQILSLGYGAMRFDGSPETLKPIIHPDDIPELTGELTNHLAGRSTSFACKFRVRARDGDWRWSMARGRAIERDPNTGWAKRLVGTSIDISKLAAAAKPRRSRAATRRRIIG